MIDKEPLRLGVAGLGAIGLRVAEAAARGDIPGVGLSAVSVRDRSRATERMTQFATRPVICSLDELAGHADVIVECVPAAVFRDVAGPAVEAGRSLMPLSVGALLDAMDLVERAKVTGARILVPTGALIGLDTVRAMAVGTIKSVTLETRKPPAGLAGAPWLVDNAIDVADLRQPMKVFEGNAAQAARAFPANVNVAAALALAGAGPEHTRVEVWADPGIDRNMQTVRISSDAGEATMTMCNVPSDENPRTGRIVAQSVITSLSRLRATLVSGS